MLVRLAEARKLAPDHRVPRLGPSVRRPSQRRAAGQRPSTPRTSKAMASRGGFSNGGLEIDNNAAERAIRGMAIGRKNRLFAGSEGGGQAAAVAYTLIETAKLNAAGAQV